MSWSEIIKCLCIALTGAATALPLLYKLVVYVKKSVQEKNWTKLLSLVTTLMSTAESMFSTGAERKEYVMSAVGELSGVVGYELPSAELSVLIDSLCAMSRQVNPPGDKAA